MAAAEEIDIDGVAVRVTNPDKVYFPELGSKGTKGRVLDEFVDPSSHRRARQSWLIV
ncbi:MAG: hypothetical protein QOH91_3520 [Mycobacterium sp.]|jgi:DNA primase|nr:hypothetical protein [Mycobacterium sp.]